MYLRALKSLNSIVNLAFREIHLGELRAEEAKFREKERGILCVNLELTELRAMVYAGREDGRAGRRGEAQFPLSLVRKVSPFQPSPFNALQEKERISAANLDRVHLTDETPHPLARHLPGDP